MKKKAEDLAVLTDREKECLKYLMKYWTEVADKDQTTGQQSAWEDLQREFTRLKSFQWFKQ